MSRFESIGANVREAQNAESRFPQLLDKLSIIIKVLSKFISTSKS